MKIETKKIVTEPEFVPFTVSFTFESKEEVKAALTSLRDDNVIGDKEIEFIKDIPNHLIIASKIYYAIKCQGK